jgi:hypothetical protein
MKYANLPLQFVAVALLVIGLMNGGNLLQQFVSDGAVEPVHALYTAAPLAGAAAASGGGWLAWLLSAWRSKAGAGSQTLSFLQAINTIAEQFQAKGVPDALSLAVTWGTETYEAAWKKRAGPPPGPPPPVHATSLH